MKTTTTAPQLSLLDIGPGTSPDFWTREEEDREDYAAIAHDDDCTEEN